MTIIDDFSFFTGFHHRPLAFVLPTTSSEDVEAGLGAEGGAILTRPAMGVAASCTEGAAAEGAFGMWLLDLFVCWLVGINLLVVQL